ncbi:hypothetical protein CMI47_04730 [Candidatus Pacearchaeota archaeon]|jgi:hypothetical protein|nr:hypothetical protein [Candidatus Pacearchaeota archaeon]|tara:strand:+ start:8104 stop:9189 length:1086 start_codon:yes stop_codon:yes gene_type:complete
MEYNLSNYTLISSLLRNFSRHFNCPFLDFKVKIEDADMAYIDDDVMVLSKSSTPYIMSSSAVTVYLQNLLKLNFINNESFSSGLAFNLGILHEIYDMSNLSNAEVTNVMKVDQFPHAMIALSDLILPELNIPYVNYRVVVSPDLKSDICRPYFESSNLSDEVRDSDDFPIIFLNSSVKDPVFFTPFIIDCYLSCYFGDEGRAVREMKGLLSSIDFLDILNSFYGNMWDEDDLSKFFFMMGILFDLPHSISDVLKSKAVGHDKSAQFAPMDTSSKGTQSVDSSFWHTGLIEKMLGPVRGYDFTIKEVWQPIVNQLLDLIEKKRKESGLSGAPVEFMLRVKDGEENCEKPKLLQDMLSDMRVW